MQNLEVQVTRIRMYCMKMLDMMSHISFIPISNILRAYDETLVLEISLVDDMKQRERGRVFSITTLLLDDRYPKRISERDHEEFCES